MGRGRAKAKQTKVARELKYSSHGMDLDALQRELSQSGSPGSSMSGVSDEHQDSELDEHERDDWTPERR